MNDAANTAETFKLYKPGTDLTSWECATVMFQVDGDRVIVSTWATWTDYSNRFEMTRDEARQEWRRLRCEGWSAIEWRPVRAA